MVKNISCLNFYCNVLSYSGIWKAFMSSAEVGFTGPAADDIYDSCIETVFSHSYHSEDHSN